MTLVVGVALLTVCLFMLFFIEPSFIQNFPPQHTYLAFYLPCFFALSFICSFFLLNSRRGFLLATLITITLWLNQIKLFSIINIIILIVTLSCIELLLTRRN